MLRLLARPWPLRAQPWLAPAPSGAQVTNGASFPPLNWGFYLDDAENLRLKLVDSLNQGLDLQAVLEQYMLVGEGLERMLLSHGT